MCSACYRATPARRHRLTGYRSLPTTHPRRAGESPDAYADRLWSEMNRHQREGDFRPAYTPRACCNDCATTAVVTLMGENEAAFAAALRETCSFCAEVGAGWSAVVATAQPGADGEYNLSCVTGDGRWVPAQVLSGIRRQVDAGARPIDGPARVRWLDLPDEAPD